MSRCPHASVAVALLTLAVPAWAGQTAGSREMARTVVLGATIGPTTRLHLSSQDLRVARSNGPVTAVVGTVEFEAAARTRVGGEVVLTVESLTDPDSLVRGSADAAVEVAYAGETPGSVSGVLSTTPRVAGRWVGSGARQGVLTFTVRSTRPLAGGTLPLRFVLSTP